MTVSRVAVASRLPRQLNKLSLRFALILVGSLMAATAALGQSSASRPTARMIASGPVPPAYNIPADKKTHVTLVRSRPVAAATTTAPAVAKSAASLERRAFDLMNAQRRTRGQQPLVWDAELSRLARQHSEGMARSDFFNHSTPNGMTLRDRARSQGIRGWSAIGENIAYNKGYDDPAGFVVERWMISSKHRDNLLNGSWTRSAIGVAVANDGRVFFTQVFLAP
jgi:uncharacterized protein YkwD